MKISLDGLYRIDELADAFDRVLQTFRQNGVDETRNVLLYLNVYHDKRGVQWLNDDGNVIKHLKFDGSRERKFKANTAKVHVDRSKAKPSTDRGQA